MSYIIAFCAMFIIVKNCMRQDHILILMAVHGCIPEHQVCCSIAIGTVNVEVSKCKVKENVFT